MVRACVYDGHTVSAYRQAVDFLDLCPPKSGESIQANNPTVILRFVLGCAIYRAILPERLNFFQSSILILP